MTTYKKPRTLSSILKRERRVYNTLRNTTLLVLAASAVATVHGSGRPLDERGFFLVVGFGLLGALLLPWLDGTYDRLSAERHRISLETYDQMMVHGSSGRQRMPLWFWASSLGAAVVLVLVFIAMPDTGPLQPGGPRFARLADPSVQEAHQRLGRRTVAEPGLAPGGTPAQEASADGLDAGATSQP